MSPLLRSGTFATDVARNGLLETVDEHLDRQYAKFSDYEAQISAPMLSRRKTSLIDQLFTLFGGYDPLIKPCNAKDHSIWILDNTAWRPSKKEKWRANYTAAYFHKDSGEDRSQLVATIASMLHVTDNEEVKKTIAERLQPFLASIVPAHYVWLQLGDPQRRDRRKLTPSNLNGVSYTVLQIPGSYKDGTSITSAAADIPSSLPSKTTFADSTGWSIISDIDDTIKKTLTSSPLGILSTTFAETPEPIAGMPEFYAFLNKKLHTPPFWYISASPYNLYPFLRSFREAHYPAGELMLRETSIMNLGSFLLALTAGVQAFKVERMKGVQKMFPRRKMICIGDSTQNDPEAYAETYKAHPGWVRAIFIRKVTGVAELDEKRKNSEERFEKAFEGVPKDVWFVFEDPRELYGKVEELLERDK